MGSSLRLSSILIAAICAVLVAALAGPAWQFGIDWSHRVRGPIVQHIARQTDSLYVPRGGTLVVRIEYEKRADCPGTWLYAVRWHGAGAWETMAQGIAGTNPPGRYTVVHRVHIPADAPLGRAQWAETLAFDCGTWATVSRLDPPITFVVTE